MRGGGQGPPLSTQEPHHCSFSYSWSLTLTLWLEMCCLWKSEYYNHELWVQDYGMSLCVSTTLQGRPHAQEWLASTRPTLHCFFPCMYFLFSYISYWFSLILIFFLFFTLSPLPSAFPSPWWYMSLNLALGRQRQVISEFVASLLQNNLQRENDQRIRWTIS